MDTYFNDHQCSWFEALLKECEEEQGRRADEIRRRRWASDSTPNTPKIDPDTIRSNVRIEATIFPDRMAKRYHFFYGPDADGVLEELYYTVNIDDPCTIMGTLEYTRMRREQIDKIVERVLEKHKRRAEQSDADIRKKVKVSVQLDTLNDDWVHEYTYGPDLDGIYAKETFRIHRHPEPSCSTVTEIREHYMRNIIRHVVEERTRKEIAVKKALDAIEKYNINPATKKEENTMPINRNNRMIPTINGGVDITDIQIYNNKVVKVVFSDGTFTKAVCGENDHFDLDIGITICVIKKMAGKDGHKWYNNLIRKAHAVMDHNAEAKKTEQDISNKVKERNKKEQERRKAGKEKAKQEQIDIHSEAFLKALKEWTEKQEGLKRACGPAN